MPAETGGRELAKRIVRAGATLLVLPALASFHIRRQVLGRDRALLGSTQALSLVPGVTGQYLRTAFLRRVLEYCHPSAAVEFGTIFSQVGTRIDENVYIGPMCHIGLAHLQKDVLVAAAVHIPSGPSTHGFERLDIPIREQPGHMHRVTIGSGSWIGSNSIVMADVGNDSVIGAGSIVTSPIPPAVIAVGTPAKVVRQRT